MTGNIRICDKDERKAASEFNLNNENGTGGNCFVNQIVCSNTGNLCAIAHSKFFFLLNNSVLFLVSDGIYFENLIYSSAI